MILKIPFIILFSSFLFLFVQKRNPVYKGYAFSRVSYPGRNRTDDNGNSISKIDTVYFIYIECIDNLRPIIRSVSYNKKLFGVSIFPVDQFLVFIGKQIKGIPVYINPKKGNRLWKLELSLSDKLRIYSPKEYNRFILNGQINHHPFSYIIQSSIELQPLELY